MAGKRGFFWLLACAALAVPSFAVRPSQKHLHHAVTAAGDSARVTKAQAPGVANFASEGGPAGNAPEAKGTVAVAPAKPVSPAAPGNAAGVAPSAKSPELPPLPPPATNGAMPPEPVSAAPSSGPPAVFNPAAAASLPATSASGPAAAPSSPAGKARMDSLLKTGTFNARDEDSAEEAEADAGPAPALPGGKPGLPFPMKKPTRKEIAAFQLAVLNAITALDKKDYPKALKALAKAQPSERLAQVYKTILMSTIYHGLKDYAKEDSVLRTALEWVGGTTWQSYLLNRRIQAFP